MPVYQSQSAVTVAYKVQSALGTQATGAGGTALRLSGGSGGQLTKAATESNEVRTDGMRVRGRHGTQKTTGAWSSEMSIGSCEKIAEAVWRDTWDAADLVITEASVLGGSAAAASITTTANTIVAASGSWITQGLRVGDVIRLTLHTTAGNNGRNLRIVALTALVITVAEVLTLNATPDPAFIITRPKKLMQSGTLVKRYFTIDEYNSDIDYSTVMTDFVWGSMRIAMAPNGLITIDPGGIGTGQLATQATATSPLLTAPTVLTGIPMSVVDATIRIGANDVVDLSSLDMTIDISPMAPDVFGSGQIKYSPDVFTGQMAITLNFTCMEKDLQFMTDFVAETQYSLHILAVENESEPKDFVSLFLPNFTLGGVQASAPNKAGGPRTQSVSVPAALIGKAGTVSGYSDTMIQMQSTGA